MLPSLADIAHPRLLAIKVMDSELTGLVDTGLAGSSAGLHQVAGEFGLPVDHDLAAPGERLQIDAVARALEQQLKAAMHQPLALQALAHTGCFEQVYGSLLEHAGPDTPEHMVGTLPLEDQGADTGPAQDLPQQQARRASTDDRYLCTHAIGSNWGSSWVGRVRLGKHTRPKA